MSAFTTKDWITRFISDLAVVAGALTETVAVTGDSTEAPRDGWVVTLEASHGAAGRLFDTGPLWKAGGFRP